MCPNHVESNSLHWHQHCDISDFLGGDLDELCCESTGQMQCKVYDSMLALSPDLKAARDTR